MRLTERHIECAHLCARLEVAGQEDTKVMAKECRVTRSTIYNWFKAEDGVAVDRRQDGHPSPFSPSAAGTRVLGAA